MHDFHRYYSIFVSQGSWPFTIPCIPLYNVAVYVQNHRKIIKWRDNFGDPAPNWPAPAKSMANTVSFPKALFSSVFNISREGYSVLQLCLSHPLDPSLSDNLSLFPETKPLYCISQKLFQFLSMALTSWCLDLCTGWDCISTLWRAHTSLGWATLTNAQYSPWSLDPSHCPCTHLVKSGFVLFCLYKLRGVNVKPISLEKSKQNPTVLLSH